ncbi:MAG: DUF362 domain-containing protein [Deltaproteobacteria bacterium]|nr:DUF362 domain-containing protein [Deltaproteobacteria bacterium]
MPISRRKFVEGVAITAASLRFIDAQAADDPDLVDVEGKDPKAMVAAALAALGGIGRYVKRGDYVVLKPNAGFANPPAWATTTHPDTVVAVAQACLEAKAKQVLILEYPLGKGERCLERCGLKEALLAVPAVKIKVLSSKDDFKEVAVKGVALKSVEVAKALLSADVFINIPAAKAHNETGVSFGLKNAMGLIWNRKAFHNEMDLHQAVADLGLVVRPHLTILDATRALLTNGPAGPGETATPGRIVAGRGIVSVDAYGLTLARFNQKQMTPADARHIELAAKAGLGSTDLSKLNIKRVKA